MKTIDEFYKEIIDNYLLDIQLGRTNDENILAYYRTRTVEQSIIEGTNHGFYIFNGKGHSDDHFNHFAPSLLAESRDILLRMVDLLQTCKGKTFRDVYYKIRDSHKGILTNLANLYYYDMAIRIAASYEIDLYPEDVFLHQGALWGAQNMNLDLSTMKEDKPFISKSLIDRACEDFKRLTPYQTESFLCTYHREIREYMEEILQ